MGKVSDQLTKADLYSYISKQQYVYFATVLEKQPKLRPMTLFFDKGRFFFVTFRNDAKIIQIKSNKWCEVLLPLQDESGSHGYLRMSGFSMICSDAYTRQEATYFCYFFDDFFDGADDPSFCLLELFFDSFELLRPGESHSIKVSISNQK